MTTILITGGAGYVGSQSVLHFGELGWRTIVLDDLSTGHADFADRADRFVSGSLLDAELVRSIFASERIDGILHCAARALVIESMERPLYYFHENITGSVNLFQAAVDHGCPPVVFSSSGTVYGIQGEGPIDESATPAPINPYGQSKHMVEQVLAQASRANGLRSVTLRYFNAAGADPEQRVGERHDPETHLIPNLLAVPGMFSICGDDFATRDGTCLRDYVHTWDLARAHAASMRYLLAGGDTEIINAGSGLGTTILEMLRAAESVLGREIVSQVVARRPGDPPALRADISRAARLLDWAPERSDIETILSDALAWHRADGQL